MIPERVSIDKRFLGADNRTRYGHWEKDAIVSRKGDKGSLAVAQERKSRLITAPKTKTSRRLSIWKQLGLCFRA